MYGLVENEIIIQIEQKPFEVQPMLKWVEIPKNILVTVGWRYVDEGFLPPVPFARR